MPAPRDDDYNLYKVGQTFYINVKVNGQQIRESLRTGDRSEARKRRDARLEELRGEFHTWVEAVGKWLSEYLPDNVDANTAKRYVVSVGQIAEAIVSAKSGQERLDNVHVERINHKTISEIVSWSKKNRSSVTNATIRRDLTALSSVLHACVGWGWREDNPARTWDRSHIKERRDPIVLPTDVDIKKLIDRCPGNFARAMSLLVATGMREMEAFGLRWSEISDDRSGAMLTNTKRDRPRFVPFNSDAVGIVVGTPRHIKSPYVFWHGDGEPYRNVASRAAVLIRGAGVEFTVHHLRHRFAVDYLRKGGSIYDLQAVLGHGSVKTTEIYLAYLDPETRQRAMRQAGTKIGTLA